jgi:hypothetical protein
MGLETDWRDYDEETIELLNVWHDWEEFNIKPWRVQDEPDGVITFFKNAIRHISGLRNQAEANKNKSKGAQSWIDQQLQKEGKKPRRH